MNYDSHLAVTEIVGVGIEGNEGIALFQCCSRPVNWGRRVVTRGDVPVEIREKVLLWVGCIAGALRDEEYRGKLAQAGFQSIGIEPTRIYTVEDAREFLTGKGVDVDALAPQVEGKFMSAFVRAVKPQTAAAAPCCAPT